MKKFLPILGLLGVVLLFFLIFYLWGGSIHDGAVKKQETVEEMWSNVLTQYQRRADLIPQIAATAKAAAENEKEILIRVTEARAGITTESSYTPNQFKDKLTEEIRQADSPTALVPIVRTMRRGGAFLMENYPEIKSTQAFLSLQTSIEGTENRISVARENYNASVKEYNSYIRGFFRSKALNMMSEDGEFTKKEPFENKEGSDEVPDVNNLLN